MRKRIIIITTTSLLCIIASGCEETDSQEDVAVSGGEDVVAAPGDTGTDLGPAGATDQGTPPINCGDRECGPGEDHLNCPEDCPNPSCGNGVCEPAEGEDAVSCPGDCPPTSCGDGSCDPGEDPTSCPADCQATSCGDGSCDPGEDFSSCPTDCSCGNGVCEPAAGEAPSTCPADCPAPTCGDGNCDPNEDPCACPADCQSADPLFCCDDQDCPPLNCGPCCVAACLMNRCGEAWLEDCCGNTYCESGESCESCSQDCGSCQAVCGNGSCEAGEDATSCPGDCAGLPTEGQNCVQDATDEWVCAPGHSCMTMTMPNGYETHLCYLTCAGGDDCSDSLIESSPIGWPDYQTGKKTQCATTFTPDPVCIGYSPTLFFEEGVACTDSLIMPPDYLCHDCGALSLCVPGEYFDANMWDDYPYDQGAMKCRRVCSQDSDCQYGKCLLLQDLTTDMYDCVVAPQGYCCLPGDTAPGCQ